MLRLVSGGAALKHRAGFSANCLTAESTIRSRPGWVSLALLLVALLVSKHALADSGADIYKAKCSACHGADGTGDTMLGKNLKLRSLTSDEVQKQSDDELAAIISKGKNKNKMPPFDRKLSQDQISGVVQYIRSLKK